MSSFENSLDEASSTIISVDASNLLTNMLISFLAWFTSNFTIFSMKFLKYVFLPGVCPFISNLSTLITKKSFVYCFSNSGEIPTKSAFPTIFTGSIKLFEYLIFRNCLCGARNSNVAIAYSIEYSDFPVIIIGRPIKRSKITYSSFLLIFLNKNSGDPEAFSTLIFISVVDS